MRERSRRHRDEPLTYLIRDGTSHDSLPAGAVVAASLAGIVPAAGQRIDIGPGGASVDLRVGSQRKCDDRREDFRRDWDADSTRLYRRRRFDGDHPVRHGYGY